MHTVIFLLLCSKYISLYPNLGNMTVFYNIIDNRLTTVQNLIKNTKNDCQLLLLHKISVI